LAATVREAVSDHAIWIISDFAIPEGWFGRLAARPLVTGLYWAFGALTGLSVRELPDFAQALEQAGFARSRRLSRLGSLLISELWMRKR
jgi:hypothetical protein